MDEKNLTPPRKSMNKTQFMTSLAEQTGLTKKQVADLFDALAGLIKQELGEQGPGALSIPGLMNIKAVHKPATEARKGINPFTKEETVFAAKPARNVVKVTPLKGLKEMVS